MKGTCLTPKTKVSVAKNKAKVLALQNLPNTYGTPCMYMGIHLIMHLPNVMLLMTIGFTGVVPGLNSFALERSSKASR